MPANDWAHKLLDQMLTEEFYGELVLSAQAGSVRKITRNQTFIAPDVAAKKQAVLAKREPFEFRAAVVNLGAEKK